MACTQSTAKNPKKFGTVVPLRAERDIGNLLVCDGSFLPAWCSDDVSLDPAPDWLVVFLRTFDRLVPGPSASCRLVPVPRIPDVLIPVPRISLVFVSTARHLEQL